MRNVAGPPRLRIPDAPVTDQYDLSVARVGRYKPEEAPRAGRDAAIHRLPRDPSHEQPRLRHMAPFEGGPGVVGRIEQLLGLEHLFGT